MLVNYIGYEHKPYIHCMVCFLKIGKFKFPADGTLVSIFLLALQTHKLSITILKTFYKSWNFIYLYLAFKLHILCTSISHTS